MYYEWIVCDPSKWKSSDKIGLRLPSFSQETSWGQSSRGTPGTICTRTMPSSYNSRTQNRKTFVGKKRAWRLYCTILTPVGRGRKFLSARNTSAELRRASFRSAQRFIKSKTCYFFFFIFTSVRRPPFCLLECVLVLTTKTLGERPRRVELDKCREKPKSSF